MVEETVDMVTNPKVTEFPQALLVKWWRVWITELVPVSSQNTRRHCGDWDALQEKQNKPFSLFFFFFSSCKGHRMPAG